MQRKIVNEHRTKMWSILSLFNKSFRFKAKPNNSRTVRLNLVCLVALLVFAFLPCSSFANMTLEKALEKALSQNPTLQAERGRIDAATGRMIQARLWPNPELEFSSEDYPYHGGGFGSAQNMVGISQTLPFPGKKSLDGRIGSHEVSAAEWEYLGHEIDLIRKVKKVFYSTLAAEKKVEVSKQLVEIAQSLADAAQKRVKAGDASDQEMIRAEIELERANVELSALERELSKAKTLLANLLGQPREPIAMLVGEFQNTASIPEIVKAREQMLAQHPVIHVIREHNKRSTLELRRARLDPYPDFTIGIAGGRDNIEDKSFLEFFVSLPLPLFDRAQGKKREARALRDIDHYNLIATEQLLIKELDNTIAELQSAEEQVLAYHNDILPKAEDAFNLVRGGFEAGKFSYLELVDTQRMFATVRLTYFGKLSELSFAQADLDALVGNDVIRIQQIKNNE